MQGARRPQSLELEDQSWFPECLRAYQTDFLGALAKYSGIYKPAKSYLKQRMGRNEMIIDLASGSGMPALLATREMDFSLTLCDKFPSPKNIAHYNRKAGVRYLSEPVDIVYDDLPPGSVYLMFNSLHHFKENQVLSILKKIKSNNSRAFFFEPISPNVLTFLKVGFATLLLPFFIVPFTKPFRWDRLLLTYIIPLGVLATFWDGIVSVQKSNSIQNLEDFKKDRVENGIDILVGELKGRFTNLTYIEL